MWSDEGTAMGDDLWHWVTDFHGIVSLIFLGLIVIGLFLLIRDMRREGSIDSARKTPSARRREVEADRKADSSQGNTIGSGHHQ